MDAKTEGRVYVPSVQNCKDGRVYVPTWYMVQWEERPRNESEKLTRIRQLLH